MTSMTKRVLTTVITLPSLFCIIVFLPAYSYFALSLVAVFTTIYGAKEVKDLYGKALGVKPHLPVVFVGLLPFAQWMEIACFPELPLVDLVIVFMALAFFSTELVYGSRDGFSNSLTRIAGEALLLLYPGLLFTFIQRLVALPLPTQTLLLFFLLIFSNDVFAFIFGMWLGRTNKGIVKVSPNKSIAGFLGGILSTVLLSVAFCMFVPGVDAIINIWQAALLGFGTSVAANIGDLIESAFKRSAQVKDSGTLVPGRGGLLDSIDSMLAGAPVFWVLLSLF